MVTTHKFVSRAPRVYPVVAQHTQISDRLAAWPYENPEYASLVQSLREQGIALQIHRSHHVYIAALDQATGEMIAWNASITLLVEELHRQGWI